MTTTLTTPSTPTQRLITATARATSSHRTRAARALDVEADKDGMQVWLVRSGRKATRKALPMPHEVTTLDEARDCAVQAAGLAAHHTSVTRTQAHVVTHVVRPLTTAATALAVYLLGPANQTGAASIAAVAVAGVGGGLWVLFALLWHANPPEVWAQRADAYKKRVTELEAAEKNQARWWWPRRV